jgi:hypothetical protein
MGKNKKKRNKPYTGIDAAMTRPSVTRISDANRSKIGQWWFEKKTTVKPILKVVGIVIVLIVIIFEIIQIASGNSF